MVAGTLVQVVLAAGWPARRVRADKPAEPDQDANKNEKLQSVRPFLAECSCGSRVCLHRENAVYLEEVPATSTVGASLGLQRIALNLGVREVEQTWRNGWPENASRERLAWPGPASGFEGTARTVHRRGRWIEVLVVDRIPDPLDDAFGPVHLRG